MLVAKASSLIENCTSNLAECFMSVRAKMDGGKMFNRIQSGSFEHRCTAAGLRVQLGPKWGAASWSKVTGLTAGSVLTDVTEAAEWRHSCDTNRKRGTSYKETRATVKYRKNADGSKEASHSYGENAQQPDLALDELRCLCKDFKKGLEVTQAEADQVECETHGQADCSRWYDVRRRRITASNFGKISRRRPTTKVSGQVKILLYDSGKVIRSPALQWGRDNEPVARRAYSQYQNTNGHSGLSTQASGFVICLDTPCLGCSPDDVVTDPSSPDTTGLAEYKCPYSLKDQSVDELLATKAASQFCLSREMDGHLRLKKSHVYYYQVQGQLAITKLPWCDFVVWSPCELHIERVRVDPSFWSEVVVKLVSFYNTALLPELASPRFPRGQSMREPTELQIDSDWLDVDAAD